MFSMRSVFFAVHIICSIEVLSQCIGTPCVCSSLPIHTFRLLPTARTQPYLALYPKPESTKVPESKAAK